MINKGKIMRNYSELNEEEQNDLFKQYKKKTKKKLNISLFIYLIVVAITITILVIAYNNFKKDYIVDDIITNYIKNYIVIGIVLVAIFFVIVLIINMFKRRGLKKVYSLGFQRFLYKKNIMLDSNNNQNNKSI